MRTITRFESMSDTIKLTRSCKELVAVYEQNGVGFRCDEDDQTAYVCVAAHCSR